MRVAWDQDDVALEHSDLFLTIGNTGSVSILGIAQDRNQLKRRLRLGFLDFLCLSKNDQFFAGLSCLCYNIQIKVILTNF